jgi:FkbM family methyltransferase
MILTTKTKVNFARILYRAVRPFRGTHVVVERRGIRWALDLNQGIDLSIFLFGAFEGSSVDALGRIVKPGDSVLDIGANIGAHTLRLAKAVGEEGKVTAFEPTDFAFAKLQRNLSLNPSLQSRVRAEQIMLAATSDSPLETEIYSSWPLDRTEGIHDKHCGVAMQTGRARVETLDDYALRTNMQRLDAIKMDVDGHEGQVLSGAKKTLERFRPAILMELCPYIHVGNQRADEGAFELLIRLLRELGYSMKRVEDNKSFPVDAPKLMKLIPDGAGINMLLTVTS